MRTQQWVARAILVIAEAGQPIVAPLHHMLGNADEVGRGRRAMPAASQYRLRSGDQRNPHRIVRRIVPDTFFRKLRSRSVSVV